MAISFPANPTDGQVFTSGSRTWVYNSAKGAWSGGSSTNTLPPIGSTSLVNPNISGQTWLQGPQILSKTVYPLAYAALGDLPAVEVSFPIGFPLDQNGVRGGVASANGLLVAGWAPGTNIYTSTDGISWTARSLGSGLNTEAPFLVYMATWSLWVLKVQSGIYTSSDGIAWTRVVAASANSPSAIYVTSITGVPRVVCPRIAIGGVTRSVWSDDGITWTTGAVDTSAMHERCIGSIHTDGRITQGHFTSHDGGVTWSIGTAPITAKVTYWSAGMNRWVYIGNTTSGSTTLPRLYVGSHVTSGAITWTQIDLHGALGEGGHGQLRVVADITVGSWAGVLVGGPGGPMNAVIQSGASTAALSVPFPELESGWIHFWKYNSRVYTLSRNNKIWSCPDNDIYSWSHVGNYLQSANTLATSCDTDAIPAIMDDKLYYIGTNAGATAQLPVTVRHLNPATEFGLPSIPGIANSPQYIRVA